MALSAGQELAIRQLREIADRSNGELELIGGPDESESGQFSTQPFSLRTRRYRRAGGLALRDRERFALRIPTGFPFQVPSLYFGHKRFVGAPHVQWGSYICLYQSVEAEWNPSDGLFGFFERADQWLAAAGAGLLDPEEAPLHPPVAYTSAKTKFVAKADAPNAPADEIVWLGRADLNKVRDDRFDLIGWANLDDWDGTPPKGTDICAAIVLERPMPLEYPTRLYDLIQALEAAGVTFGLIYKLLRLVAVMTEAGRPAHMVLGAPMRRKATGEPLKAHLTVWEIEAEALELLRAIVRDDANAEAKDAVVKWMASSNVAWCTVLEDRPEIVHRRDTGSLASDLAGKRVLLLGCGALGSAIAESVVRAGAAAIELVDNGMVKPGLLVRQRYADADVGRAKVFALRDRLNAVGLSCAVTTQTHDLKSGALGRFALADWDLIVDATASASVAHTIEREVADLELAVPLITVSVSAAAQHGSVGVKMPGYRGGSVQIARQAKIHAFERDARQPLVRAFWPDRDEIEVFQPEPGCSAPTFVGSAFDLDFHAAALFNMGLARVLSLGHDRACLELVAAPWLRGSARAPRLLSFEFAQYAIEAERLHGRRVLEAPNARQGMLAEIARIARARSSRVETGGLLFGEVDDAHGHIWIDSVSGPPADSVASATKFLCGTAGTTELAAFKARTSGGSSKFVGIWHTHPVSRGEPSEDDLFAMAQLLHLQRFPPRQVVMLIVGFAATRPEYNYYLFHRDDIRLTVEPPEGAEVSRRGP